MSASPELKIEPSVTNSLFEEAYWLDSVAPGAWRAAEVVKGGEVVGRLPFVLKRRLGIAAISTTWYTPWLGPWVKPSGAKAANEVGHQHEVLGQLLQDLPRAQRAWIACAPEWTNMMAFHWAGYALHLHYTFRLDCRADEASLWEGLRHNIRKNCRKAAGIVTVTTERSLADVLAVLDLTYKRQGLDVSKSYPVLERIDETMRRRNQRRIFSAEDSQGRIHAFVYVVFDDRHSFYLAGGGDPDLRNSGAQALAMWHAIRHAASRSQVFDFEGSMIPGVEHFVRGFGASLTPRYCARRDGMALQFADVLVRGAKRLAGR